MEEQVGTLAVTYREHFRADFIEVIPAFKSSLKDFWFELEFGKCHEKLPLSEASYLREEKFIPQQPKRRKTF